MMLSTEFASAHVQPVPKTTGFTAAHCVTSEQRLRFLVGKSQAQTTVAPRSTPHPTPAIHFSVFVCICFPFLEAFYLDGNRPSLGWCCSVSNLKVEIDSFGSREK